jgi:cyclopropane-fatty-acyl-phospholipid synthase
LRPGDRVVEAGCGWGSFALHMARQFGVSVVACNISREQVKYARKRAEREGLSGRVQFVEDDYRNLTGTYDVFVSVGMLEHVGLERYEALGSLVSRLLAPNGRGLLHFIGRDRHQPLNAWIRRRIFPGAYPPTLDEVCGRIFEPAGLSVLDVENLRLHYATTLSHWRERFECNTNRVAAMFDESFVRAWRLYLAGSQAAFETGGMQLFQVVFAPHGSRAIPWTRPS